MSITNPVLFYFPRFGSLGIAGRGRKLGDVWAASPPTHPPPPQVIEMIQILATLGAGLGLQPQADHLPMI